MLNAQYLRDESENRKKQQIRLLDFQKIAPRILKRTINSMDSRIRGGAISALAAVVRWGLASFILESLIEWRQACIAHFESNGDDLVLGSIRIKQQSAGQTNSVMAKKLIEIPKALGAVNVGPESVLRNFEAGCQQPNGQVFVTVAVFTFH